MRQRFGCRGVLLAAGVALMTPALAAHCPGRPRRHEGMVSTRQAPACLEAWVRLRSYRGCPVLAVGGGYRLGLFCSATGWSNGALVFAGRFPGRAYVSEQPVPRGRWVHVAGLEGIGAAGVMSAIVAIDGVDLTAGRFAAGAPPLPLGYDPWEAWPAARPTRSGASDLVFASAAQIGAWRFSRRWRTLPEVAAGRGSPAGLAPLAPRVPMGARPPVAARSPAAGPAGGEAGRQRGGVTRAGWTIFASAILLAIAMMGAGIALRSRRMVR